MKADPLEGVDQMSMKPAIRITAGDVPAPHAQVNVVLFGGHLDGLRVADVEVAGTWPVITTLEPWARKVPAEPAFIPRRYQICLCSGRVHLDKTRRVRYCLSGT